MKSTYHLAAQRQLWATVEGAASLTRSPEVTGNNSKELVHISYDCVPKNAHHIFIDMQYTIMGARGKEGTQILLGGEGRKWGKPVLNTQNWNYHLVTAVNTEP